MDNLRDAPMLEDKDALYKAWRASASYRLMLVLSLVLLGLALLLTIKWPSYTLHLMAFRSPLTLNLSLVWPLVGLLTVVMALGMAFIFRQHPSMRGRPLLELMVLWPLPALIVSLAALLLQRISSGVLWAGGIAFMGLILYLLLHLECQLVGRPPGESQWAEWTIHLLAYLLALTYFALISQAGLRTLLSAPAILLVGGLLAVRLLHGAAPDRREVGICALAIGLVLGEATWALNYWPGRSIVGGVLLLLIFYLLIGLARQGLQHRLTWSALLEYGIVALLGLGLLLRFG